MSSVTLEQIDDIYKSVRNFVKTENYEGIDKMLLMTCVNPKVELCITLLTATLPIKNKLIHRAAFYYMTKDMIGTNADKVLTGLK